mmetsp:Transcript_51280/g.90199  ORF Transcript_51280/g.90199 Transcript_51280/m.90199 type:complete len:627 (-) Transcript_51280:146-2026(-)
MARRDVAVYFSAVAVVIVIVCSIAALVGHGQVSTGDFLGQAHDLGRMLQTSKCSGANEDCRSSKCCADSKHQCYGKNEWWAECKPSCTPGIDPKDLPAFQTPWKCNILSHATEAPVTYAVEHKYWTDDLQISFNGSFHRLSNIDGGLWSLSDNRLLLNWNRWGQDVLTTSDGGHTFSGAEFKHFRLKGTWWLKQFEPLPVPTAPPTPVPTPATTPTPTQPPALDCVAFNRWPDVDNGRTCGNCTALVYTSPYGGKCDTYCASFGHICVAAAEEEDESCTVQYHTECNKEISGTSDMLCTCRSLVDPTPTPAPTLGPPSADCVKLLVIGDYGSRGSSQRRVSDGMAAVAAEMRPEAIAGIGDNIYGSGAEGKFENIVKYWSNVYLKHASLQVPWYIVTGNHDWYTDARTERDFTTHSLNNGGHWNMPNFWYKRSFNSKKASVDAFFIDTMIWQGDSKARRFIGDKKLEQKNWLTAELQASTADWKIVFGHHPVYSAGSHGITTAVFNELDPLMRKYGVQAFFAGHDHSKQLMQHRGLNYVISGAGGKTTRGLSNEYPVGSQKHFFGDLGFASIAMCSSSSAELRFYNENGQVQATAALLSTPPDPEPEGEIPPLVGGRRRRDSRRRR